jgi:hypothetical protein
MANGFDQPTQNLHFLRRSYGIHAMFVCGLIKVFCNQNPIFSPEEGGENGIVKGMGRHRILTNNGTNLSY